MASTSNKASGNPFIYEGENVTFLNPPNLNIENDIIAMDNSVKYEE
jgi:hypothetical protein